MSETLGLRRGTADWPRISEFGLSSVPAGTIVLPREGSNCVLRAGVGSFARAPSSSCKRIGGKTHTSLQFSQALAAPLLENFCGAKLIRIRHACVARLPQAIRARARRQRG